MRVGQVFGFGPKIGPFSTKLSNKKMSEPNFCPKCASKSMPEPALRPAQNMQFRLGLGHFWTKIGRIIFFTELVQSCPNFCPSPKTTKGGVKLDNEFGRISKSSCQREIFCRPLPTTNAIPNANTIPNTNIKSMSKMRICCVNVNFGSCHFVLLFGTTKLQ